MPMPKSNATDQPAYKRPLPPKEDVVVAATGTPEVVGESDSDDEIEREEKTDKRDYDYLQPIVCLSLIIC